MTVARTKARALPAAHRYAPLWIYVAIMISVLMLAFIMAAPLFTSAVASGG